MANETETQENNSAHDSGNNSLTLGFSFLAGTGMVLMMTAAGIGVIQGIEANDEIIGFLFVVGAAAFVVGLVTWMGIVQPWASFDDINEPLYHGHHHEEDDHATPELEASEGAESPALPASTH